MFTVNYRDPRPIYEQIKSGLRGMLTSGEVKAGDRLPSVRDMAVSLTVNPNTIQKAYRELESEGFLVSVQGRGCFVSDRAQIDREKAERLLKELDTLVAELKEAGIRPEDISARIWHGGVKHD